MGRGPMSQQALDLRRSLRTILRYRAVVGFGVGVGVVLGAAFTFVYPPMYSSEALVVLPPGIRDIGTQVLIADSLPVVASTTRSIQPTVPVEKLVGRVHASSLTPDLIAIRAQGTTGAQAEDIANAVTHSYLSYVGSANSPGGQVIGRVLQPATSATGTSLPVRMIVTGVLGALLGALIGAITALALGRSDRKLRERDEIAGAIGLPVLASLPIAHPSGTAGWRKLLEHYEPTAVHAWGLRKALHQLGVIDFRGSGGSTSLSVLSLSSDRRAVALGPQLAVFAASLGIPTELVIDSQQDVDATAKLRSAVSVTSPGQAEPVRVVVGDHGKAGRPQGTALSIVVAVIDSQAPRVADTMRTTATVLAVSAGAATADQLARIAVSAADDGRDLAGIIVVDPDPADHTSGRMARVAGPTRRGQPTRSAGATSETGR